MAKMIKIALGDRVRVKNQKDWPSLPGYVFANAEGTVVKWIEWDEVMSPFQDYAYVQLTKTEPKAKEYIGKKEFFRIVDLEKV